jgi:hypothetical protein
MALARIADLRRVVGLCKLGTPDATQVATRLRMGATLAATNDEGWRKVSLIETLVLPDR